MDGEDALMLGVEFVDESGLWSWEIRDGASQRVVAAGWTSDWMGYPTREQACQAGLRRLGELRGGLDEAETTDRLERCDLEHTTREILGSAG